MLLSGGERIRGYV